MMASTWGFVVQFKADIQQATDVPRKYLVSVMHGAALETK